MALQPNWTPPETDVLAPPSDCRRIIYEIQESEFVEAYFNTVLDANARKRLIILMCISVAIVGIFFFKMADVGSALLGTAGVGAFAYGFAVYFKWKVIRNIRKRYKTISHSIGGQIELIFGDGFLGSRSPRGITGTSVLYGVKKLPNLRLIFPIPNVFSVVPLRAFENASDVEKFDLVVSALSQTGASLQSIPQ